MQMNALRSANLVKLSSSNATSDEYWLTSMSDGTPGGYCLSQIRSMGLSPQNLRYLFVRFRLRSPDRLVSGSIGKAAQYGKRLRVIDAFGIPCAKAVNGGKAAQIIGRTVSRPAWALWSRPV